MDNVTYQEMPCVSSHWLKDMLMSPAHCYRSHIDPQRPVKESTKAMQFGTLVHCLALTPLQLSDEFLIASYERRTKAGKARYAALAATGKIIITPKEFDRACIVVSAIKAHPDARKLLTGGKKESTIIKYRKQGLLPLKARLDIHHEAKRMVIELKTSHDIQRIEQSMEKYHYPLSAAFYADITKSLTVQFVFVQTHEPFDVVVFELSRLQLQKGHELMTIKLQQFDECWTTHHWPEAPPTPEFDDDPLMMPFMPMNPSRQRYDLPVGELAL